MVEGLITWRYLNILYSHDSFLMHIHSCVPKVPSADFWAVFKDIGLEQVRVHCVRKQCRVKHPLRVITKRWQINRLVPRVLCKIVSIVNGKIQGDIPSQSGPAC